MLLVIARRYECRKFGRHPGFERFASGQNAAPSRAWQLSTLLSLRRTARWPVRGRLLPAHGHHFAYPASHLGHKKRRQQTLISFIWSPGNPLPAGTGGSENYTAFDAGGD